MKLPAFAILAARAIAVVAVAVLLITIGRRWNAAAAADLLTIVAIVAGSTGIGIPVLVRILRAEIHRETATATTIQTTFITTEMRDQYDNLRRLMRTELDTIHDELHSAVQNARDEGQVDGVLRERLGRVAGDPPRPHHHHRRADRMTDSGAFLRPVRD